jgi:hypothetical protein
MSRVEFDRSAHLVRLLGTDGNAVVGPFAAYNNVDSHSKGPWPDGSYSYIGYNAHSALADPDSEYGVHGILIFDVPNRLGMGVHSGRLSIPDGLGRSGPQHCTLGCIRTTDEAMAAFLRVIDGDPLQGIEIGVVFTPAEALPAALPRVPKAKRAPKSRAPKGAKRGSTRTKSTKRKR